MAQFVVRNLDESVKSHLKRRAARNGRSMEEEAREILRKELKNEDSAAQGLGTFIARHFAGKGLDFEIPEWRGEEARPAKFRK
jgi:plasmid stability protein